MITFNRPDYLNDFEISNFQGTKKKKIQKKKKDNCDQVFVEDSL